MTSVIQVLNKTGLTYLVDKIKSYIAEDKPSTTELTIDTLDWYDSGLTDYPYAWDWNIEGLTADDIVTVTIVPSSLTTAIECGLCPTCETSIDMLKVYAAEVPATDISAEYYITKGKVSE
ncbi:MAG: hypothetical protein LIO53_06990 [Oscillospiraceae bacterium]|nr:hypothetical protein [Oscillospiraceae bacterium]